MPQIEASFARFIQRMEGVQAFVSSRSFHAPVVQRNPILSTQGLLSPDMDATPSTLNGPGWYDSSWDLIQGLVVRESTAAGAGRLDDWSQCLFA